MLNRLIRDISALSGKLASGRHCFAGDARAIAATEFALMLPFMMILMVGSFELSQGMKAARKITLVADTVGELLSQNGTGTVGSADLSFAQDSAMLIFPDILAPSAARGVTWDQDPASDIKISMSGVAITLHVPGCTSNCLYDAKVAWTAGPNPRPCGTVLTPVPNSALPSSTTLPTDTINPSFLIVVDAAYDYKPSFGVVLTGSFPLKRAAYFAPRNVNAVKFSNAGGGGTLGAACPGY